MTFKNTEKEIIKAIVKYGRTEKTLSGILNASGLLEKRGIGIVPGGQENYFFLRKDKYEYEDNDAFGYITDLISLVDTLIKKKYMVVIPFWTDDIPVIGKKNAMKVSHSCINLDYNECISLGYRNVNWFDARGNQIYWPHELSEQELSISVFNSSISISQELKNLVKHNFKSEDEIRFIKQQRLTWISILVAAALGICGIIY